MSSWHTSRVVWCVVGAGLLVGGCGGDEGASCEDDAPDVLAAVVDELADVAPPEEDERQDVGCEDSGAGHVVEARWTYPGDDGLDALVDVRDHLEATGWETEDNPDDFVGLGGSYAKELGVDVFIVVALEEAGGDLRISAIED